MAKKKTKEQFISEAVLIHGVRYDYSKFNYQNAHYKSIIICPEHGEFWQTPHEHISGKQGCPKCGIKKCTEIHTSNTQEFIEKARQIHGDKYDYSKVEYINNHTKVCIICPEHGEFWQIPNSHLNGHGCPICARNYCRLSYNIFTERANKIHNNRYIYPEFICRNNKQYVEIICPTHGLFRQKLKTHLDGCGCPECYKSTLENNIREFLKGHNINFIEQQMFDWLKYKKQLKLDFYLPDYNIAIECQGQQHFKPIKYFGGESELNTIIERDRIKKDLCESHNIKILYYSDKKNIYKCDSENIILNLDKLIKEIIKEKLEGK